MRLDEVADEISRRLIAIFEPAEGGRLPVFGGAERFQSDAWRDDLLFYEYFHGDNGAGIGAAHQTGWTGLVAVLVEEQARRDAAGGDAAGGTSRAQFAAWELDALEDTDRAAPAEEKPTGT